MSDKKPYLVDVPVAIQAFIRPHLLEKQWEIIKQARPSILFIRSDGPRNNVPTDKELIEKSRSVVADVDWECEVHRFYFDENQGMYGMSAKCTPKIWEMVDRCIWLEDDQIPAIGYFRFCAELLEKYKDDPRVYGIHGVNLCGSWDKTDSDYFFARVPASSGMANWRRSWQSWDRDLHYVKNQYVQDIINKSAPWYIKKQFDSIAKTGSYAGHTPGSEFFVRVAEYCQNQLFIVPKYNQISNVGVGEGSTHTAKNLKSMPKALAKTYGLDTTEFEFPLKHPEFVIADVFFEKEREKQLGVASRFQSFGRLLSRYWHLIIGGDFGRIKKSAKKVKTKELDK